MMSPIVPITDPFVSPKINLWTILLWTWLNIFNELLYYRRKEYNAFWLKIYKTEFWYFIFVMCEKFSVELPSHESHEMKNHNSLESRKKVRCCFEWDAAVLLPFLQTKKWDKKRTKICKTRHNDFWRSFVYFSIQTKFWLSFCSCRRCWTKISWPGVIFCKVFSMVWTSWKVTGKGPSGIPVRRVPYDLRC